MFIITAIALSIAAPDLPTVVVNRDNTRLTQSCNVRIDSGPPHGPLIDADGNGVIHIAGDGIVVRFEGSLSLDGALPDQSPDSFAGQGIVITGRNVTLSGARVRGYKVGIHAINADGLTIHDCDVSDNFAQRLKSTPKAEDSSDWLWPHNNDNNEWIANYGAGLCVEDSSNVTLRGIVARRTQNGIVLDAVNDSKVYDCDCSFLSGWGLAMWRSSRNIISRNAFDFCVQGYSHGVYNRGQDSAGILAFEQCCENLFIENSATHGGDGFFGFAGKEALGEANSRDDLQWYKRRGNNDNTFVGNDFSYAPAHGLEMTFSFGNRMLDNRFVGNAICGIWGGYSSESIIASNHFEANGEMAYGLERGGINIEHGQRNLIARNVFLNNKCGVHLWWDNDAGILKTPWARINGGESNDNRLLLNEFTDNTVGVQLRETTGTVIANMSPDVAAPMLEADAASRAATTFSDTFDTVRLTGLELGEDLSNRAIGDARPVGARTHLAGREHIIMTEWGPWDHASPLIQFVGSIDGADEYRLLGNDGPIEGDFVTLVGDARVELDDRSARVSAANDNTLTPYQLSWISNDDGVPATTVRGVLVTGSWKVTTFSSPCDPREDVDRWRAAANDAAAVTLEVPRLDFAFGSGGMTEARQLDVQLPRNHFGVIATRTLSVPRGRYRINTTSDDGIRVWLDDELVIDDWTWHAPKRHHFDFELNQPRTLNLRVEYFELDGHAVLAVEVEPRL